MAGPSVGPGTGPGVIGIEQNDNKLKLLEDITDLLPSNYLIKEGFGRNEYVAIIRSDNENNIKGVIFQTSPSLEKILKQLKGSANKSKLMEKIFNDTKIVCDSIAYQAHKSCNALSNLISSEIGHFRMPNRNNINLKLPVGRKLKIHGKDRTMSIDMSKAAIDTLTLYFDGRDLVMKGGEKQGRITNDSYESVNMSSSVSVTVVGNVITTIGKDGSRKEYTIVSGSKGYLIIK